jgi:hypothetical protein
MWAWLVGSAGLELCVFGGKREEGGRQRETSKKQYSQRALNHSLNSRGRNTSTDVNRYAEQRMCGV